VKKEFFQLLVTELLCPDYGMLIYQPESRTYWFNPATLEADAEFLLLGLVRRQGQQAGPRTGRQPASRMAVPRASSCRLTAARLWAPPQAGAGAGHLQRRAAGLPAAAGAVPQDSGAGGEAAGPGGHAAHAGAVAAPAAAVRGPRLRGGRILPVPDRGGARLWRHARGAPQGGRRRRPGHGWAKEGNMGGATGVPLQVRLAWMGRGFQGTLCPCSGSLAWLAALPLAPTDACPAVAHRTAIPAGPSSTPPPTHTHTNTLHPSPPRPHPPRGEPPRVCGALRSLLAQPLHPLPVRGLCQGLPHALRRPRPAALLRHRAGAPGVRQPLPRL
jgi:hypothetical protein